MNRAKNLILPVLVLLLAAVCVGCGGKDGYTQMKMTEAEKLIEEGTDYLIVDVRTKAEYDAGHIPGAILLPSEDIKEGKLDALPDQRQKMMIYCRTGRRSAASAEILAKKGYTNVCDIGGIVDWKGEIET